MDNTTWHDQRPSHKPIPKAVVVANEHAIIARKVYDDYIEYCLNNPYDPLNWTEIDKLAKKSNDADQRLEQARHEALNPDECTCKPVTDMCSACSTDPCTCKPDGDACPVCVGDNKQRYGDRIPFEMED